jgi:Na+/glutamate symporter
VTLIVALWLLLLVMVSEYDPAVNPAGSCATTLRFANATSTSVVWAKATVGASPAGLKLLPEIVRCPVDVFKTVL